ncbi:helix-turn-helix domain-containing protein, partial [Staphylococcus aureus]
MDAAFVAFGTVGYWNTTMKQIADDCDVTRAGLLHHFPTKEALLEAVLGRRDELNRARFFQDS